MSFPLLEHNRLDKSPSGVWRLPVQSAFSYSDGALPEAHLKAALEKAQDLSSLSLELERRYAHRDWMSEYHLSTERANLLRAFDLHGISAALELGCGCGALTRYLGEQDICVDAIEGSMHRAEIARLRCRDQANVNVICANFNDLTLPKAAYDAVFLVGVLEYARMFLPAFGSHREAVFHILSQARDSLTPNGILFVAIENRMGLKYWLGASEDHYGRAFEGLYGYPDDQGIRTYDFNQWQAILKDALGGHYRFAFPFPDYKLPKLILSQPFLEHDPFAHSALYGITSRDYTAQWQPAGNEYLLWRALHGSGYLPHLANAFVIVASESIKRADQVMANDFTYFSFGNRRAEFRVMTWKARDEVTIRKKAVYGTAVSNSKASIRQVLKDAPYVQGPLLSTLWMEALNVGSDIRPFQSLLKRYFDFVAALGESESFGSTNFDLLPSNIVVDDNGSYRIIDEEWVTDHDLDDTYILFRSLLWFAYTNRAFLAQAAIQHQIVDIKGFIDFGFGLCALDLEPLIDDFIAAETRLQQEISFQSSTDTIAKALAQPFYYPSGLPEAAPLVMAQVYWSRNIDLFKEINSCAVAYDLGAPAGMLTFRLLCNLEQETFLRFDPADRAGFFSFSGVALKWVAYRSASKRLIWEIDGAQNISAHARMEGIYYCQTEMGDTFMAHGDDPYFVFRIPPRLGLDENKGYLQFEAHVSWPRSAEYLVVEKALAQLNGLHAHAVQSHDKRIRQLSDKVKDMTRQNIEKTKQLNIQVQNLTNSEKLLHDLRDQNKMLLKTLQVNGHRLGKYQNQLAAIEQSKTWRLTRPLRRIGRKTRRWTNLQPAIETDVSKAALNILTESVLFDPHYYRCQLGLGQDSKLDLVQHFLRTGAARGIAPHPLFDTAYYLQQNADVTASGQNPLIHFIQTGHRENRRPHPLFDHRYYRKNLARKLAPGENPLIDFIQHGALEGHDFHPLFDTDFYCRQCPDLQSQLKSGRGNPLIHYLESGAHDGKNPHPLFDTQYYLKHNPDVADRGLNPLIHFVTNGFKEHRNPHALFDIDYYLSQLSEESDKDFNPVVHYIEIGALQGKKPNRLFDGRYYWLQGKDPDQKNENPLIDYIAKGAALGRNPHPLFDSRYYIENNPEVAAGTINPLAHYLEQGWQESINPHPLFDASYYRDTYPDINAAGINPLTHFIDRGGGEARNPGFFFDTAFYLQQVPELAQTGINPLIHYLQSDDATIKNPFPNFDSAYYLRKNPDVAASGTNPLVHFTRYGAAEGRAANPRIGRFKYQPTISVICSVNQQSLNGLQAVVRSLLYQIYPYWELILISDSVTRVSLAPLLKNVMDDKRIRVEWPPDPLSACQTLNRALGKASGEFVFFSDSLWLKIDAFYRYANVLNTNSEFDLILSEEAENDTDEHLIPLEIFDPTSRKTSFLYIGKAILFRKQTIEILGGFLPDEESWRDRGFLLRYIDHTRPHRVMKIPEVLYCH